jgi:hypothetical protein
MKGDLFTLIVQCGHHLQQYAGCIWSELEHVGIIEVVIGNERVRDGVKDISGTAAVLECRVSDLHPLVLYNDTSGWRCA